MSSNCHCKRGEGVAIVRELSAGRPASGAHGSPVPLPALTEPVQHSTAGLFSSTSHNTLCWHKHRAGAAWLLHSCMLHVVAGHTDR